MKKSFSIVIVSVFIAAITVFTALSVFAPKKDFSVAENRELQAMPEISLDSINEGDFQREYNDYLSDQFIFREFWVKAKTDIMLTLGKRDINSVYIGSNGYLIEKYREDDFNNETVDYNIAALTSFLNKRAEEGYNVTCAFIPSKGTVLTDKLPKNAVPYDTSYVTEGVKNGISKDVRYIDFTDVLKKHSTEDIYFKTDHHWTQLGAYYAYGVLSADTSSKVIGAAEEHAARIVTEDFYGSTFDKLQLNCAPDKIVAFDSDVKVQLNFYGEAENADTMFFPAMLKEKNKYEYFLGGNYARCDITTNVKNGKTLLLLKDSYSNALVPFLAKDYEKIIMLDLRYFKDDIRTLLEKEKINDIFAVNNVEKFMVNENQSVIDENEELPEEEEDEEDEDDEDDGELTDEELENERILQELEEQERLESAQ